MRYEIDRLGIRELHFNQGLAWQMYEHAKVALAEAKALAPVHSGEYRRRMFVRRIRGGEVGALFGTHSYKGWWVEYGTINNGAYHILTAAAHAAGMKVRHRSKPGGGPIS